MKKKSDKRILYALLIIAAMLLVCALIVAFLTNKTINGDITRGGVERPFAITGMAVYAEPFSKTFGAVNIPSAYTFQLGKNVDIKSFSVTWSDNGRSCRATIKTDSGYDSGAIDVASPATIPISNLGVSSYVQIISSGCSQTMVTSLTVTGYSESSGSSAAQNMINLSGATITGTNGENWGALIDGVTTGYTGSSGFGWTDTTTNPPGSMTLDLKEVYVINGTSLLLWNSDDRYYRYKIESSLDGNSWMLIVNRTTGQQKGWQNLGFDTSIRARYLRLTGTYNSLNPGFHVVEWQVFGTSICTPKGTGVTAPIISQAPTACVYGQSCDNVQIISNAANTGDFGYEFYWTYNYADGTSKQVYGCNGTTDVNGKRVYTDILSNKDYVLPVIISDDSGKVINSVQLAVSQLRQGNRSGWVSAPAGIAVTYNCANECNTVGRKAAVSGSPDKFKVCSTSSNDSCLHWGLSQNCSTNIGYIFNETSQSCVANNQCTFTCLKSSGKFCNNTASVSPANAQPSASDNCCDGSSCFACNTGFTFNDARARCINASCSNTCEARGGLCSDNATLGTATINNSLDCCGLGNNCFTCGSEMHWFNNTCASNACSGNAPQTVNGTLTGANTTSGAPLSWQYSNATLGTCKWKCMDGYHKVTNETFNGCDLGWGPCADYSGICYTNETALGNAYNINGTCSGSDICYRCSTNFNWNGSACTSCTNTCTSSGGICSSSEISNANANSSAVCCGSGESCYKCAQGYSWDSSSSQCACANGCTYNNRCVPVGMRLQADNQRKFCSSGKTLENQKAIDAACSSNYECVTNSCNEGKCVSLVTEVKRTQNMLGQLISMIQRLFGIS